jgi:hypothetical protein
MSHDTVLAHKVARAELMKRVLIVVTTALVIAVLVLVYLTLDATKTAVGEIRATQTEGSPVLKAIADQQDDIEAAVKASTALNEAVLPCFDPTSECAKEGAAQEAARAGAYNAAVIAAQFCVDQVLDQNYTLEQLTRCVGNRIHPTEGTKP